MAKWISGWAINRLRALTLWLLGVGVALLLTAGGFWMHEHSILAAHRTAVATVTEYVPRSDPDGKVRFYPTLRFRLEDGSIHQFTGPHGTEVVPFSAGEQVRVMYPAGHPEQAQLATNHRVYRWSIPLGITGFVLFDVGCVFWFEYQRRLRPAPVPRPPAAEDDGDD